MAFRHTRSVCIPPLCICKADHTSLTEWYGKNYAEATSAVVMPVYTCGQRVNCCRGTERVGKSISSVNATPQQIVHCDRYVCVLLAATASCEATSVG